MKKLFIAILFTLLLFNLSHACESCNDGTIPVKMPWDNQVALLATVSPSYTVAVGGTFYTDSFTGANQNPLAGNWSQTTGTAAVQRFNNKALPTNGDTVNSAYWSANSFNNDQYSQVVIVGTLAYDGPCVRIRTNGASYDAYCIIAVSTTSIRFQKYVAGSGSVLGSAWSVSDLTGHTLEISVSGSSTATLTAYIDGVQTGSPYADSSSPITTGSAGFMFYDSGSVSAGFINWQGGY